MLDTPMPLRVMLREVIITEVLSYEGIVTLTKTHPQIISQRSFVLLQKSISTIFHL